MTVLVQEEAPNPLIPHVPEIIVGLVAFGLLYYVLSRFAFPVFERTYRERVERIEGGLLRAEQAQAEAEALLVDYRAQLANARAEASRIRTEAQAERQSIVEEARREAIEAAEAVHARAQAQLNADRQQALTELSREVGRIAVDLAGKIVGESLADDARAGRTVDRFLSDLESGRVGATEPTAGAR
ncbi:MAG TPA: F0F1 ATP synthase subunit B [Mycobacteriales bacterium]|nr:F0F1 ATP synthase subunit B [Mycobacteriales bacterium]